jgi:hypothetical protein
MLEVEHFDDAFPPRAVAFTWVSGTEYGTFLEWVVRPPSQPNSAALTHHPGFFTASLAAAADACAMLPTKPKHVAPEPDIRTLEKAGSVFRASKIFAMIGWVTIAACVISLRQSLGEWRSSGVSCDWPGLRARLVKTLAVEQAASGLTSTMARGSSIVRGVMISPMPCIWQAAS